jgi:hypothetical protein
VIWSRTRQRCPVGSHATTTWEYPASAARASPQPTASDSSHALHRTVRRASTFESWSVNAHTCLSAARSNANTADSRVITARSRASFSLRRRSPRDNRRLLPLDTTSSWCGWDSKPENLTRRMSRDYNRSGCHYAGTAAGDRRSSLAPDCRSCRLPGHVELVVGVGTVPACLSSCSIPLDRSFAR